MALTVAVQLLTSALVLLQLVSANPSLPQSVKDTAQQVAQQAILQATQALATQTTSALNLSAGQGSFSYEATPIPLRVNFTTSTTYAGVRISDGTVSIDFGDSSMPVNMVSYCSPSHCSIPRVYSAAGTYTARLMSNGMVLASIPVTVK